MPETSAHPDDTHYLGRSNWLRAAVLGANDGIVSVSALVVGVAAANPDRNAILIAGVAGLAAGAMSMAAGAKAGPGGAAAGAAGVAADLA